ncbi:hypothetical protein [Xenorhabdus sp. KJ12.1]|uniref:hypothetical protein n=1 Tax=Xenorhabdus sp. KJ12.1 TaxID=1851571 RepID=UPI00129042A9|nr:hypothetical protein [Xenorhabdus sp. KJ12.1]
MPDSIYEAVFLSQASESDCEYAQISLLSKDGMFSDVLSAYSLLITHVLMQIPFLRQNSLSYRCFS